jgi:hypothetical protein
LPELSDAISRFHRLAAETPQLWRAIDIRTIAAELDGRYHNLLCVARLDRRTASEMPSIPELPLSPPVACFQRAVGIEELPTLLEQLREGSIPFGPARAASNYLGWAPVRACRRHNGTLSPVSRI